jgi:hypothetical protein
VEFWRGVIADLLADLMLFETCEFVRYYNERSVLRRRWSEAHREVLMAGIRLDWPWNRRSRKTCCVLRRSRYVKDDMNAQEWIERILLYFQQVL